MYLHAIPVAYTYRADLLQLALFCQPQPSTSASKLEFEQVGFPAEFVVTCISVVIRNYLSVCGSNFSDYARCLVFPSPAITVDSTYDVVIKY